MSNVLSVNFKFKFKWRDVNIQNEKRKQTTRLAMVMQDMKEKSTSQLDNIYFAFSFYLLLRPSVSLFVFSGDDLMKLTQLSQLVLGKASI
jgi:hypothetical protein